MMLRRLLVQQLHSLPFRRFCLAQPKNTWSV